MRVVHLSITPLAGGPYRLVSVLRRETGLDVRLIDWKRWGNYPQDVVFEDSREEALELVSRADVIHLHNYIDLGSRYFDPIDLEQCERSGKAILRQFRTAPATLARKVEFSVEQITAAGVPSIVIAQYPERYYPHALVVPNSVPSGQPEYQSAGESERYDICYSPSMLSRAWSARWDTKGGPETIDLLRKVQRERGSRNVVISGRPLREVLAAKRVSRMIIDDLVTGSYHASGLEALCLGKAVLCHLDLRTEAVLKEVSGCSDMPFVNVRLEEAEAVLQDLLAQSDLTRALGEAGRRWIDTYWSERILAERYSQVYRDLLEDPSRIRRQESLRLDSAIRRYFAISLPDVVYSARGKRFQVGLSVFAKTRRAFKQRMARVRKWGAAIAPASIRAMWRRAGTGGGSQT